MMQSQYFNLCLGRPVSDEGGTGVFRVDLSTDGNPRILSARHAASGICFSNRGLRAFGKWLIDLADGNVSPSYAHDADVWLP